MQINSLLELMTNRIVEGFAPQQIILFGSHARGEATADSDIDLLIVFPELESKRQMAIAIRRVLSDLPIAKDVVVTTPTEIAEYGQMVGTILRPALREGKVIYEQKGKR
ncbi:MAG: nucleotidyltransferase domain-containing protein [Elainellaceae cyanobacterium]